ncbi:FG-GAP repeat domain-containing protein [Pacificibacter marinus]|uniref:FG-GAP repeat domain-containing protein n=1 Tax=Pacificibacter marinus TaxID=658057 RepID=UPI001C068BA6|nr:VCBS repeat-containing protein [Pacificibacter marinus]MBU2868542.1 VCBS repeat-containing protein [Pacificibacter marinus]
MRFGAVLVAGAALCAVAADAQSIVSAKYVTSTDAYGHGAVAGGEYAELEVTLSDGKRLGVTYRSAIFEDTAPRLHDFDKDGSPEIVTVVSTFTAGARVQVFTLHDGALIPVASNPPIGTRNRWLAIAGIADFNGDGMDEVAYVDRPHLAKVLRLLSVDIDGSIGATSELVSKAGLTNHHYQAPMIEGGVRNCAGHVPVIVTADADWKNIVETQFVDGVLHSTTSGPYTGAKSFDPFLTCETDEQG